MQQQSLFLSKLTILFYSLACGSLFKIRDRSTKIKEWIDDYITLFYEDVITYPNHDSGVAKLCQQKGTLD